MKAITRRLCRLEDQIGTADRPCRHLRLMVMMAGAMPCLEDATCTRTLCADGTLLEMVWLEKHNGGLDEPTDEELNRWVESFPVQGLPR